MARGKNKKPRAERRQKQREVSAREAYEFAMLEAMRCPRTTAFRVQETIDDGMEIGIDGLTFLNSADHVWRDRPEHAELHSIIVGARDELVRQMEILVKLSERLSKLPDDEEHEDLTPEEVVARLEQFAPPEQGTLMDGGGGDP